MHGSSEIGSGTRQASQQVLLDYCRTVLRPDEMRLRAAMEQYAQSLRKDTLQSRAA